MSAPVVYVVAQHGEDQAMAFLGECGPFGVLDAMREWDESRNWSAPHWEYEWTDWPCLDVYALYHRVTEHDAVNDRLVDLSARFIGHIQPVEEPA